jgi:hypothetical protein
MPRPSNVVGSNRPTHHNISITNMTQRTSMSPGRASATTLDVTSFKDQSPYRPVVQNSPASNINNNNYVNQINQQIPVLKDSLRMHGSDHNQADNNNHQMLTRSSSGII